ncbi:MAG: DUF6055 domain-containing protein [Bacteroidales bacterium]
MKIRVIALLTLCCATFASASATDSTTGRSQTAGIQAGIVISGEIADEATIIAEEPDAAIAATMATEKELYIPERVNRVPEGNDYNDDESDYSFSRMIQSANIAVFWHKEYGSDPLKDPAENKRFDAKAILDECERFYNYYIDVMKFTEKGMSLTDKYKMLVYVYGGDGGTAFGGGSEEKVGIMWTPSSRVRRAPYAVMAHEMVHAFQYISRIDAGTGPRGAISEMAAQYHLWQVYPEWMTFENYHLVDFMKKTHFAFLHSTNMYHSPYVLEYWSYKRGIDYYGRLSRETRTDEDPVMTYKRMYSLTQEQFNDEMFDACRRFITWDLPRIREVAAPYANQHHTSLIADSDGWYRIPPENCPQNYGYNGIRLNIPKAGTRVRLQFEGIAGTGGYNAVNTDKAGWRYGFVAYLKDGSRVYGDILRDAQGKATFRVPKETEYLWLVVSGAPTEHWPVPARRGAASGETMEEQWPYKFKLSGTTPDDSVIRQ